MAAATAGLQGRDAHIPHMYLNSSTSTSIHPHPSPSLCIHPIPPSILIARSISIDPYHQGSAAQPARSSSKQCRERLAGDIRTREAARQNGHEKLLKLRAALLV